jgi:hypothetical protein
MTDLLLPFIVFTLLGVIVAQFLYIYSLTKAHALQQEKMVTAFLARDATDYAVATKIEKSVPNPEPVNPDETTLDQATDDEFDRHIQRELEEEEQ